MKSAEELALELRAYALELAEKVELAHRVAELLDPPAQQTERANAKLKREAADVLAGSPRRRGPDRKPRKRPKRIADVDPVLKEVAQVGGSIRAVKAAAERHGVKLELGTRGRTSHPNDPDAGALSEHLVHTTEEPK